MLSRLWCRRRAATAAKRCLVEHDLVVASDAVRDRFPGRGDIVGAFLRGFVACVGLRQLVFSSAVVLEDAWNPRLDHGIWMVVGIGLRFEISSRVVLLVSGRHPVFNIEMGVAIGLETCRVA